MRELYLFRHGETLPLKEGQNDSERKLSVNGRRQAKQIRHMIDNRGGYADLVISSGVPRTNETATIAGDTADIVEIPELYIPSDEDLLLKIMIIAKEVGGKEVPVQAYLEHRYNGPILEWIKITRKILQNKILELGDRRRILVIAHAPLVPLLGGSMSRDYPGNLKNRLCAEKIKSGEGIRLLLVHPYDNFKTFASFTNTILLEILKQPRELQTRE